MNLRPLAPHASADDSLSHCSTELCNKSNSPGDTLYDLKIAIMELGKDERRELLQFLQGAFEESELVEQ